MKDIEIPLNIFQTWHTKELAPGMRKAVDEIKFVNPEFKHYLYDDIDCRKFIEEYFDSKVLFAYDNLVPGAYKADLWRYCVLYVYGGIYLDIKYVCESGFKLFELTDKEYFVLDKPNSKIGLSTWVPGKKGIYNGLIVSKPNNIILLKAINKVVFNVQNGIYGINDLYPTGPGLLGLFFSD
jgi:phosphoglycolate phosphatase-like HAD superfamily hydrolase